MNHIPESPPECEALLAEALETLAKFPIVGVGSGDAIFSWWSERCFPTIKLLSAHLNPDSVTPST